MSRLDLIVGPNGAGKTTLFERIIAPERPGLPFVNADRIATDRFPGRELEQSYAAAEIATAAHDALIAARIDFCTETVFSHPSKVELVASSRSRSPVRASWLELQRVVTAFLSTSSRPGTRGSGRSS